MTSIIERSFKHFKTLRRNRTSAYLPGTESINEDIIIKAYMENAKSLMYKGRVTEAAIFTLKHEALNVLNVEVKEFVWADILKIASGRAVDDIYGMLRDCIKTQNINEAIAAMNADGKLLLCTRGCNKPQKYKTDLSQYEEIQMGTTKGLSKLFIGLNEQSSVYLVMNSSMFMAWQGSTGIIVALLGYPYSKYVITKPYNVDFWATLAVRAPEVYKIAKDNNVNYEFATKKLADYNLGLVDHKDALDFVV